MFSRIFATLCTHFIPIGIQEQPNSDEYRRTRLLLLIASILIGTLFVYLPLVLFLGDTNQRIQNGLAMCVGMVVYGITFFVLRGTGSVLAAGLYFTLVMSVILSFFVVTGGGFQSPMMSWLVLPILISVLIAGRKAGIIVTCVLGSIITMIGIVTVQGSLRYVPLPPGQELTLAIAFGFIALGIFSLILIIAGTFENWKNIAFASVETERNEAKQQFDTALQTLTNEQESARRKDKEMLEQTHEQQRYLQEHTKRILDAMQRFAAGDLTVRVSVERDDDIGRICDGFNRSIDAVEMLVQQVIHNVEQTTGVAVHLNAASAEMALSSKQHSSQMAAVASSLSNMAHAVGENAEYAVRMNKITEQTGRNAVHGADVVLSAVSKIQEIAGVVTDAAGVVEKLGDSSAEIGEIVQVIEEIADQTNLLALNAAIEAARAGDQGRGFAVVADEVRKLAERTAQATKQISQTIKQIQSDTNRAVNRMQKGDAEVQQGLTLAKQAGEALDQIVSGTHEVGTMVKTSTEAMELQSTAANSVAQNIQQMSESVEETTTGLDEIALSTRHLRTIAEQLQSVVNQFEVSPSKEQTSIAIRPRQLL